MSDGAPLAGRHALVTGGGTGLGAAIAAALSAAGAAVTVAGRRREPLDALCRQLPQAQAVMADVTVEHECVTMAQSARTLGPLDIVIANAGAAESAPAARTDAELWQRMLAVNLTGAFYTVRAALADLTRKQSGDDEPLRRIVFVASIAGLQGFPYVSAYCAAKHGVIGLMRALAEELRPAGVTVNAVCPGYAETPMLDRSLDRIVSATGQSRDKARSRLAAANPGGRLVTPAEVADAVLRLCAPAASHITGQAVPVPESAT